MSSKITLFSNFHYAKLHFFSKLNKGKLHFFSILWGRKLHFFPKRGKPYAFFGVHTALFHCQFLDYLIAIWRICGIGSNHAPSGLCGEGGVLVPWFRAAPHSRNSGMQNRALASSAEPNSECELDEVNYEPSEASSTKSIMNYELSIVNIQSEASQ